MDLVRSYRWLGVSRVIVGCRNRSSSVLGKIANEKVVPSNVHLFGDCFSQQFVMMLRKIEIVGRWSRCGVR